MLIQREMQLKQYQTYKNFNKKEKDNKEKERKKEKVKKKSKQKKRKRERMDRNLKIIQGQTDMTMTNKMKRTTNIEHTTLY